MTETAITQTATSKAKSKPVAASAPSAASAAIFEMPKFEMPKFEMPKFEMPKMEVPAAFREMAEKGIAMAKDNYEKMKSTAEEATEMLEETYSTASKGCTGYGLKVIEAGRANANASFDLMTELLTAKSYAEVVELSTAFMRKQFDTMTAQAKELAEEAQKVATDTAEPIKDSFTSAFNKAA